MATEAEVLAPLCETKGEQVGNLVDQATNISINKLPKEEQSLADTVEGEILIPPSIGEVRCEVHNNSPDVSKVTEKLDQTVKDGTDSLLLRPKLGDPLEVDANEETNSEEIKSNAEESNGLDKDEDRGVVPVQHSMDSPAVTSEMRAGDTLRDPNLDDVRVETEGSKDITSDHHCTNDSFIEEISLSEEKLQVTNLPSEETKESETPFQLDGEELHVQLETTEEKTGDGKTTEEDIKWNLTSDVSKGECDQNKKTSEQEGLGNERNFEDNLDAAAEKASQENSTFIESITNETSKSDELQSKNDLSSSFHKEEDIAIQKDDRSVTTPDDSGIILENTLNESHGDVEYQSKMDDTATNHSDPSLTEKSEGSSSIQIDGSQIERDEQLVQEHEKLPLTEASKGSTNEGKLATNEKVKDEDEDLRKAELFEDEQNTSTLLKEDVQIENPAESLHVDPGNSEASNLGEEKNTKGSPEEQSTKVNLHENTQGDTEEKPIDASFPTIASSSPEEESTNAVLQEVTSGCIDEKIIHEVEIQKEVENFPTTVSNEDVGGNSTIKLEGSENENEEHSGKESDRTSSPLPLAREASDNESIFLHEARTENEELRNAEFCESEKSEESVLLKTESKIEKTEKSWNVVSEDIRAPDLGQERETRSSIEEQTVITSPQGILDEKTEEETVDAAETKETLEAKNVPTINPYEKTQENSSIQVDSPKMKNEDHLEKDREQSSSVTDCKWNTVTDEVKIEDENPSRVELFKNEKNTESALLKEEVQTEKPVESLHAAVEDIKASDLGQHTETTGSQQSLTENPQGSLGHETEEKMTDAADTEEKNQELQNVSNEDNYKDSSIQKMESGASLEEELERPLLTEASTKDANDNESIILLEPKIGDECLRKVELLESEKNMDSTLPMKENLQDAPEDHNTSIEDTEITGSLEEESLVMSDKTIEATDTKEVTLEVQNVATEILPEHTEENSVTQVDCSQMEHKEHLEKDGKNSFSTEAPTEETNAKESKGIHESQDGGKDSIKAELENEKITESTLMEEETQVEKPIDSSQAAPKDIKASDSSQDTNSSIEEQILTAGAQEISSDKTEQQPIDVAERNDESLADVTTNIPDGDNEDNKPTTEDDSQKSSLEEASIKNKDDEESTITHEGKLKGDNEKITACNLVKEEVSIESLQVAAQDVKSSTSDQDRETTSTEVEQSLTTNPQDIMDEKKTNDATSAEEENTEDKHDAVKTTPYKDTEENLPVQVDCPQLEQNEDAEKDSENTSLTEALIGDTTASASVKEETQVEKPTDLLQVATEDIKASAACQVTSSIEEQIQTADSQEISCDKTEEKVIDAADTKKKNLEDIAKNILDGDNKDKTPTREDDSQKSSLEEASIKNNNDEESTITHEAKLEGDNEKITACNLVKEEVSIESLQVAVQVKSSVSGQDRETTSPKMEQSLTTNAQEIMDEKKTNDATSAEEENIEDKHDAVKTTPYKDTEENLPVQVDCPQLEQNADAEKNSENTSLTEALIGDTTESASVKEETQVEKPTDLLQVATEDIKASAACQVTSSIEEQIQTADSQKISCNKTEEKVIDAADTKKESLEDIATNIPDGGNEDKTPTREDDSQKSSLEEASIKNNEDEESTITHQAKLEDDNEKIIGCNLVEEEVSIESLQVPVQEVKSSASGQDRETTSLEVEQSLTTNPQEIMDEKKTNDATSAEEENTEDKHDAVKTTPYKDTEENLPVQVDWPQLEQNADAEKDSENTSLTEALIGDTTESASVKEEAQVEKPTDLLQVATEDIKASSACQVTSSIEEQIQTADSQEISCNKTKEKVIDAADTKKESLEDIATNIPDGGNEDKTPTREDDSQKSSLEEASIKNNEDEESTITHQAKLEDDNEKIIGCNLVEEEVSIESLQVPVQEVKSSALGQDRETTSPEVEQSLTTNPQEIMDEKKTSDATSVEEENIEDKHDAVKITPYKDTEENLPVQVDWQQLEQNADAEKDSENTSLTEALIGDTTESASVKEETQVEKPTDLLQVATEDIKASSACQVTSSIEEQIQTADSQEISCNKTEEKVIDAADTKKESLEDIATNIPDGGNEDKTPTREDDSQKSSLEEASIKNNEDEESTITHQAKLEDDNEKIIGCNLVEEEVSIESLQVPVQEVKSSASSQDRETTSLEVEQSLTTNPQEIIDENKANDATSVEEENTEDKQDIVKTTQRKDREENLPVQVHCPQLEQNKDVEKDSENTSLTEALIGDTTESALVKEKAQVEKPIDLLQVATENMEASSACQVTSSTEEQIQTADSQEISFDKTEEKVIDAADTKKESLEESEINVPNKYNEDDSTIEVDGSKKPSLEKASTGNTNNDRSTIIHEARFTDENTEKVELFENEKDTECSLVNEKASVNSLEVANEDTKATASDQDRETSHQEKQDLTTNPQGIMGDLKEDKTIDKTDLKEVIPEDKNVAKIIPHEDTEENSLIQVHCSEMEQKEDLEKESENTSLTEITEGCRTGNNLKEELLDIDSVKASFSSQHTETSSTKAQVVTTSPQEVSCYKTDGKTTDTSYTKDETLEDITTNIPDGDSEDNTPTREDGSQKSFLEEASIGNADHEATIMHEAKFVDESLIKVDLLKNEENTEDTSVKEDISIESLQVAQEDIKASTSVQHIETLEEQSLATIPQEIIGDNKADEVNDAIQVNEETPKDKNCATTSYEGTKENSQSQVSCSQLEHNEHLEKDSECASLIEAPTAVTTEITSKKEEAEIEGCIDSLQVTSKDIKAYAPCQDTETSSTEEQIQTIDSEDISSDKTIEKTIDAADKEETLEVQDIAKSVLHGDNDDNSPTKEDDLQKPSSEKDPTGDANDHDNSFPKADCFENEKNTEDTLTKKDVSTELSPAATEDIKASSSSEDREKYSQQEQILSANPGGLMGDNKENKTIDPTELEKETPEDEVPKEIENVDVEATGTELKEEEGDLKDLQMATAVNIAVAHEEKDSNSTTLEILGTKDLDVNEDVVGQIDENPNCKQEEPSITEVSEEHIMMSNENVPDVTSLAPEVSELNNDHKVVGEANSCGDKTDMEKIGVLDDGSIRIPTNETLAETDPEGSTEEVVQVPNGEKEEELVQQDPETETDQKNIKEELLINASHISESKGVNGEEEKTNSDNCKEITGSSNSVALEEVSSLNVALEEDSTSNSFEESRRETREETEDEEAQKEEELHVTALVQDSSMEKIEKDVQLCLASANDSDISQEIKKIEEAPLPAPDENIIETKECKESEVEEDATRNKEQNDTTESFLDDEKPTEREQEKTQLAQEKVTFDEKVEITKSTLTPAANDFLPVSFSEISEVDHSTPERELTTDREELHTQTGDNEETKIDKDRDDEDASSEQKTSDLSSAASNMIEARNQDVASMTSEAEENFIGKSTTEADNFYKTIDTTEGTMINESTSLEGFLISNSSITEPENKLDEAPEITETTPTATESQDVESISAGETSALISTCKRDGYEHAHIGSVAEEKSDSNEVAFAPGEQKSGYESKNQVLESVAQVQTCDKISETEEANLEAAGEIKSDKVVAEDIFEEGVTYGKEILKDKISSEKIKEEDEDVKEYHQGSCEEEVITEHHLEEEIKVEEEINREDISEVIKNEKETEKVSKVPGEVDGDGENSKEPEENLLSNESIDRSLHQKEQAKSVEEVITILDTEQTHGLDIAYVKTGTQDSSKEINSYTAAFPEKEDNRTGADDTNNEMAKDEGLLNQNSNTSVIDAAARELPKGLDENIICEAPPTDTGHKTIEDSEAKKENANTVMMQQQEEGSTSKHEILPLPELAGEKSEKKNQKDEICGSEEVQGNDEENLIVAAGKSEEKKADTWSKPNEDKDRETWVEAEKLDFSSHTKDISEVSISDSAQDIPKDNEKHSKEEYPSKGTESQTSTVSDESEQIEQASQVTRIITEVQEPKAGIDSGAAVSKSVGVESQQVEEVNDECKVMAETSTPVEPPLISTSKVIPECTVGTSLEPEDQQINLHDLPQELNIRNSEVKAEEKDDPMNLQNVRDISEDVQEFNAGSFEVSNKENPVEADPDRNIETAGWQEMEANQNASVSETLKQETEGQQLGRTSGNVLEAGVDSEEKEMISDKSIQLENSCSAGTEKVSESNIHQSSVEDTAQHDRDQESQRQIETLPILPIAKCSGIEIAAKDLPLHFAGAEGTDVTELEVKPLPSQDKCVVLEADHTKNLNPENTSEDKNISAQCSQGEHEILKPSKVEQEEAACGNEERTDQETGEKPESKETNKPSLSDLCEVSVRETSQMADDSAIDKDEAEHEDAKSDDGKDDEEESSEQRRSELSSEAPIIVNIGDADVKVSHKKSHSILSGVGSKVKHSIAKVKKAITGKSSHPKPPSPKKVIT